VPWTASSEPLDRLAQLVSVEIRFQQPVVEAQVQLVGAHVGREGGVVAHPDLADRHPGRVHVEHLADHPVDVVHTVGVEARIPDVDIEQTRNGVSHSASTPSSSR